MVSSTNMENYKHSGRKKGTMKKQHRLAFIAYIIAVIIGAEVIFSAFVRFHDVFLILSTTLLHLSVFFLPWVIAYKHKIGCFVCGACLIVEPVRALIFDWDIFGWNTSDWDFLGQEMLDWTILSSPETIYQLCWLILGALIVIWTFKPFSAWILYVPPTIMLGIRVVDIIDSVIRGYPLSFTGTSGLFYVAVYIVLLASVYLLTGKKLDTFSIEDSTGYTYLDEYKKNMKK